MSPEEYFAMGKGILTFSGPPVAEQVSRLTGAESLWLAPVSLCTAPVSLLRPPVCLLRFPPAHPGPITRTLPSPCVKAIRAFFKGFPGVSGERGLAGQSAGREARQQLGLVPLVAAHE
jgi:hypothetical protein